MFVSFDVLLGSGLKELLQKAKSEQDIEANISHFTSAIFICTCLARVGVRMSLLHVLRLSCAAALSAPSSKA
jgi:hypothetical protein